MRIELILVTLLVAATPGPGYAQGDCSGQTGSNEVVGTLLGAAVGGLLGSRIGSGSGNKVAIGAGVLAGGLLGNRFGQQLDCRDRGYHGAAANTALETQPVGQASAWNNPDTGHSGTVTPTRTYYESDGTPCRNFTQTIWVDGRQETAEGTACRQADGTWKIIGS